MLDYYCSYGKSWSITVWQKLKGLGLHLNGKWAWIGLQVIWASWWFDTVSCKDCISAWFWEKAVWSRFKLGINNPLGWFEQDSQPFFFPLYFDCVFFSYLSLSPLICHGDICPAVLDKQIVFVKVLLWFSTNICRKRGVAAVNEKGRACIFLNAWL